MALMIVSVRDKRILDLQTGRVPKRFPPDLVRAVQRRLRALETAKSPEDLRIPNSNNLEALKGGRKGQFSIRVNRQWRICFRWTSKGPADVELADFH